VNLRPQYSPPTRTVPRWTHRPRSAAAVLRRCCTEPTHRVTIRVRVSSTMPPQPQPQRPHSPTERPRTLSSVTQRLRAAPPPSENSVPVASAGIYSLHSGTPTCLPAYLPACLPACLAHTPPLPLHPPLSGSPGASLSLQPPPPSLPESTPPPR
jgi:hypothetical protein